MRKGIGIGTLVAGFASVSLGSLANADRIAISEIPSAVMKTVQNKYPKAKIREAEKDEDNGVLTYDIELTHEGYEYDVDLSDTGKVRKVEKTIKTTDIPKIITDAVKARHADATIRWAKEITRGETTTYEIDVKLNGNRSAEVKLASNGSILEDDIDDDND